VEASAATGEANAKMQSTEVEIAELDVRLSEAVATLKAAEARDDTAEKPNMRSPRKLHASLTI